MLWSTTTNTKRGGNSGTSSLAKAGFVLAAAFGILLLGDSASAQYQSDYRRDDWNHSYSPIGLGDSHEDFERSLGSYRTDRPAYGDFYGDRYSPEPDYGRSRDRLSRTDDRLRDRLDSGYGSDRWNDRGYDDYLTRRIPLPDYRDDRLDRDR